MAESEVLNQLRREYAAQLDLPEDRVELVKLDLDILNRMGTFVRIFAGGLTMFMRSGSWTELGVPKNSTRQLRYKAPPKYLIDPKEVAAFRALAQRARGSLESVGVDVEFMHPYHWVGYKNWLAWRKTFEEIQSEWHERRQRLIDDYDQHMAKLVDDFEAIANEAYDLLDDAPPRDEFVAGVVAEAVAQMPSIPKIKKQLILEYRVPALALPSAVEEEIARTERQRRERELARQAEKERQIELMFQQRMERLRRQAESLQAPLEEVLQRLFDEVERTATETLRTIREHGGLRGRSGERLRNLAGRVQMLEDLGQKQLLSLARQAGALTGSEDVGALQAVLRQMNALVEAGAKAKTGLSLVAQETGVHTWRSVCLACRHVWESTGSLEPKFCPRCRSNRIASREVK